MQRNSSSTFILFLFLLHLLTSFPLNAQPPQTWIDATLPIGKWHDLDFSFYQQYRFELSGFKLVDNRYSLYIKRQLHSQIDSELHATVIYSRGSADTDFTQTRRIEVEINPHYQLRDRLEFKLRNRYERLWLEGEPRRLERLRQRQQWVWDLQKGPFNRFSIHNEIFYNFNTHRVDEYRLVPCELGFQIPKKQNYRLYQMIRWRKESHSWDPQYILGLSLRL